MRKFVTIIATAALVASLPALAQSSGSLRYRWHDAKGLPHYSDSLSSEAMKNGYDLVNDQGLVMGHVARQLTADERVAAQKLAAEQAAQRRQQDEQARADVQLLSAYPDESAYRLAQQQTLDTIDQQMATTRINLRSQEKALTDLLGRAADLERAKQPVPKYLVDSIAKQRSVVTGQRNVLERQQQTRQTTGQQEVEQLQHYRDLKAAQANPAQ
jgi:hypothetical protein